MCKGPFVSMLLSVLLPSPHPIALAARHVVGYPLNPVLGPADLCLPAIVLAVVVEGMVLFALARLRGKPVRRLLLASAIINVVTVTALSVVLGFGWIGSATSLVTAEVLIWLLEAVFLMRFPGTRVSWRESLLFSLAMNAASLLAGAALVRAL